MGCFSLGNVDFPASWLKIVDRIGFYSGRGVSTDV
jgi:hypothetical protein